METLFGGIAGYVLMALTSNHKSPVRKRLPHKKIKNLHILPSIKIEAKNRVIHLHHWLIFGSAILAFVGILGIIKSGLLAGFLSGGMIQGLTFADRFKIIHRVEELSKHSQVASEVLLEKIKSRG